MNQMAPRSAVLDDLKAIAKLEEEVYTADRRWSYDDYLEDFESPDRLYLVYQEEETLVGYAAGYTEDDVFYITVITTDPRFRGKGIAKVLYQDLHDRAKAHGVKFIKLEVDIANEVALNWYKRLGFTNEDYILDYYGPKEDAFLMSLAL